MNKINRLFSLTSLAVVLVTAERFSGTTKILIGPHGFLSVHELVQMTVLILFTVIVPALLLRELSAHFTRLPPWLYVVFIAGVYFYATGNGVHETAGFTFFAFCDSDTSPTDGLCGSAYINDFYTGNIMFFVGALLITTSLLIAERSNPQPEFENRDMIALVINAFIYSATVFAYAGLDRVLVGLVYSVVTLMVTMFYFWPIRRRTRIYPFTTYTTITYALGTVGSVVLRLVRG